MKVRSHFATNSIRSLGRRKEVLLSTKDLRFGYIPFLSPEEGYGLVGSSSLLGSTCFPIRFKNELSKSVVRALHYLIFTGSHPTATFGAAWLLEKAYFVGMYVCPSSRIGRIRIPERGFQRENENVKRIHDNQFSSHKSWLSIAIIIILNIENQTSSTMTNVKSCLTRTHKVRSSYNKHSLKQKVSRKKIQRDIISKNGRQWNSTERNCEGVGSFHRCFHNGVDDVHSDTSDLSR